MDPASIRIPCHGRAHESLTASVQALLAWAGLDVDYDELNTALGLSFVICALEDEPSVSVWMTYARDVGIAKTAPLYGLRVRPLHPRPATRGLATAPEFLGHFVDSYSPLIRQSLRKRQPVLAWQGWPAPYHACWGLLTQETDDGSVLRGVVAGSPEPVELVSAAVQCYVIEEIAPQRPAALAALAGGIDAAHLLRSEAEREEPRVLTGPDVYEHWVRHLEANLSNRLAGEHASLAAAVASNREAAVRFLRRCRDSVGTDVESYLDSLVSGCQATADALRRVVEALEERGVAGTGAATAHLREGGAFEAQTAAHLEGLGRALGAGTRCG